MTTRKTKAAAAAGGRGEDSNSREWDCPACTYKNSVSVLTCAVCQQRKGSSTRRGGTAHTVLKQQQDFEQVAVQKEKVSRKRTVRSASHQSSTSRRSVSRGSETLSETKSVEIGLQHSVIAASLPAPAKKRPRRRRKLDFLSIDRSKPLVTDVTHDGITVQIIEYIQPDTPDSLKRDSSEAESDSD